MHRSTRAALTIAAVSLLTLGASVSAQAAPAIPVSNGQETTGAKGGAHGFFTYEIDGNWFCYTASVTGLTAPAVAAHIHVGARKDAGPVVIPLVVPLETSFEVSGCTLADPGVIAGIEEDPGSYYVNIHTPTYPGGEVRGQLK